MKSIATAVAVGFMLLLACTSIESKEVPKSRLYKRSELSLLMRKMHDAAKELKKNIADTSLRTEYKQLFEEIQSATPSDLELKENNFDAFAYAWQESWKDFLTEKDHPEEAFNRMVDQCLNCHNNRCPGPISKIKRLKIKDGAKAGSDR